MKQYCYFTFKTVHLALRAEKVLSGIAASFRLIPVPRFISSNCGVALQCCREESEAIQNTLQDHRVSYERIHIVPESSAHHG